MGALWRSHSCLRPVDNWEATEAAFRRDATWFYEQGLALPPTILFDLWLATSGRSQRRDRCVHAAQTDAPRGRDYHRSLDRLADFVVPSGAGPNRRLAVSVEVARALGAALGLPADGPLDSAAVLRDEPDWSRDRKRLARMYARVTAVLEEAERFAFPAPPAAISLLMGGLPPFGDVDEVAYRWMVRAAAEPYGEVPPRVVAQHGLVDARRRERSETGEFLERAVGRMPSDPARLAPEEFLFRRLHPVLFAQRIASNAVIRSFGQDAVEAARQPHLLLDVEVGESDEWNRATAGGWATISLLRAFLGDFIVRIHWIAAAWGWPARSTLRWTPVGSGPTTWEFSLDGASPAAEVGRLRRDVLLALAPVWRHDPVPVAAPTSFSPQFVIRVRALARQDAEPPEQRAWDVPLSTLDLWHVGDGQIGWRVGTDQGTILAEDLASAARTIAHLALETEQREADSDWVVADDA